MAFTAHSTMLKFGFILSIILIFLGLIILGSMAKYGTQSTGVCILFYNGTTNRSSICAFSVIAGVVVTLAGGSLFALDYMTWKKSENYKGKRASVATLFLAPLMTIFSFCTAIVIGLGIKSACSTIGGCSSDDSILGLPGIYTALTCTGLAGLLFAIYAASEYVQYRRRHINGDKW